MCVCAHVCVCARARASGDAAMFRFAQGKPAGSVHHHKPCIAALTGSPAYALVDLPSHLRIDFAALSVVKPPNLMRFLRLRFLVEVLWLLPASLRLRCFHRRLRRISSTMAVIMWSTRSQCGTLERPLRARTTLGLWRLFLLRWRCYRLPNMPSTGRGRLRHGRLAR